MTNVCFNFHMDAAAALAKTIGAKREWNGLDFSTLPTLDNAAKGLSPFALMDLSDDEVAAMAQDTQDLDAATSVTVDDIIKCSKSPKVKAVVPTTSFKMMKMLKQYANLLFSLFSSQCPLYVQLYEVINTLLALSEMHLNRCPTPL